MLLRMMFYKILKVAFRCVPFTTGVNVSAVSQVERPRVMVLTDIENEPDDAQSMVRFLTYANQWNIEGLVATTSYWLQERIAEEKIFEILRAYKKVQPNLNLHEPGFPTYEELKSKVKKSIPRYGKFGLGEGNDSEGSDWIIAVMEKHDPRPLYVLIWGGSNCLAQALWKMHQTKTPDELKR